MKALDLLLCMVVVGLLWMIGMNKYNNDAWEAKQAKEAARSAQFEASEKHFQYQAEEAARLQESQNAQLNRGMQTQIQAENQRTVSQNAEQARIRQAEGNSASQQMANQQATFQRNLQGRP